MFDLEIWIVILLGSLSELLKPTKRKGKPLTIKSIKSQPRGILRGMGSGKNTTMGRVKKSNSKATFIIIIIIILIIMTKWFEKIHLESIQWDIDYNLERMVSSGMFIEYL